MAGRDRGLDVPSPRNTTWCLRFLMLKEDRQGQETAEAPPITELVVVENWDAVLEGLAPHPDVN